MAGNERGGTERVASRGGVEVALHRFGGSGPLLVMAHANGFPAGTYGPLARAGLLDHFTCVGVDMRGHGRARWPADLVWDWDQFGYDVLAALDASREAPSGPPPPDRRVFGFGHSLGGAAMLLAAAVRPGGFEGIFTYEPIVFPPDQIGNDDPPPMAIAAERRRPTFPSRDAAIANFASKPPLDVLSPESLEAYVDSGFSTAADGTVTLRCPPAVEAAVFRASRGSGVYSQLGGIECQVTVATGEGGVGPVAFAPAVAAILPAGRLVSMPGLGHFGPFQDPPRVAATIVQSLLG